MLEPPLETLGDLTMLNEFTYFFSCYGRIYGELSLKFAKPNFQKKMSNKTQPNLTIILFGAPSTCGGMFDVWFSKKKKMKVGAKDSSAYFLTSLYFNK